MRGGGPGTDYVYVLVHMDQAPEQVLVQAAHAAAEAGSHYLDPGRDRPPSMVILAVPDEASLLAWAAAIAAAGIRRRVFHEPDFAPPGRGGIGHHSALATEPVSGGRRRVFAGLRPVRFPREVSR